MGLFVGLQHNGTRGLRGCKDGAPVFITVKRFNNKAQGRRIGGAPWGQRQKVRGTPTGSDNLDGHIPRTMSRILGIHPAGRMFNPVGVGGIALIANPGCAAYAATLGFVVERLRRKQRSGRTVARVVVIVVNRALGNQNILWSPSSPVRGSDK